MVKALGIPRTTKINIIAGLAEIQHRLEGQCGPPDFGADGDTWPEESARDFGADWSGFGAVPAFDESSLQCFRRLEATLHDLAGRKYRDAEVLIICTHGACMQGLHRAVCNLRVKAGYATSSILEPAGRTEAGRLQWTLRTVTEAPGRVEENEDEDEDDDVDEDGLDAL
jgi:hypothetical protein